MEQLHTYLNTLGGHEGGCGCTGSRGDCIRAVDLGDRRPDVPVKSSGTLVHHVQSRSYVGGYSRCIHHDSISSVVRRKMYGMIMELQCLRV
jgi:hypothetical protein